MPRRHKLLSYGVLLAAGIAILVLAMLGRASDGVIAALAALATNMSTGFTSNARQIREVKHDVKQVKEEVHVVREKFNGGLRDTLADILNRPTDLPATITLHTEQGDTEG